jgi:hypothetical protein
MTETLDERRARLRDGRWHAIGTRQTSALVPVNRYGSKRLKNVYRAQLSRWSGEKFELDYCTDNHLKASAAETCGRRLARLRNAAAAAE